jgi:hypothetical protein
MPPLCFVSSPEFFPFLNPIVPPQLLTIWYQESSIHGVIPPPLCACLRPEEATDPNICLMLEEFQRINARFTELQNMEVHLGDKIDGRCGTLEQRVNDVE